MKAFIALEKCAQRSEDNDAVRDFAQFMAERGIPWPAQPTTSDAGPVQLLDVLLDLSINWRVALWFDVSAAYSDIDGSFVVTISELGPLAWHRMQQLSELNYEDYAALARNMSSLLTNDTAELGEQDLAKLRDDDIAVRSTLLSLEADDQHDVIVPLHKIEELNGVISSDEWIALLKKRLISDFNISSHTEALLTNKPYLARIFALIGNLSAERALNVTGWMFAYVYAWTATSSFDSLHGTAAEGTETYTLCFLAVQESFGIAHAAFSFARRFLEGDRRRVSDVLKWTAAALVHTITGSQSVSNSTKNMASTKIQTAEGRHFWPPEPFFHLDTLDALYDNFPAQQQDTFFTIWTKSRKALRTSLTNRYYGSLMTARYSWPLGNVLYVYSHNWVRIALWAFYPPSYLKSGSSAMAYGGLGFHLARALVRAVDEHGRRLDHLGREKSWWEQTRKCKWDLAHSGLEKRMIADLFALEVALSALKRSSGTGYGSHRIRGLESLSEAQTFFVSFCSHYCDDPEGPSLCSLATNTSEFAEAFSCEQPLRDRCLFV
ncbi:hypothetical protein V5799_023446 [Amblyomma americanum]|uniref:Uncharacterized protein n=1 Tax=Amblyomma americanum TaxID=6943 RepID=A0AAQ4FJN4_AMBAM